MNFQLGEIVKKVLEEEKIEYAEYPSFGGEQAVLSNNYAIKLPVKKVPGMLGLFGKKLPVTTLKDLTEKIANSYLSQYKKDIKAEIIYQDSGKDNLAKFTVNSQHGTDRYILVDVANIIIVDYKLQ